jgi:hypothetical protein
MLLPLKPRLLTGTQALSVVVAPLLLLLLLLPMLS